MKIDRLLGIIVLLIHKKRMKAVDLSNYFEVAERTIYRDMETLSRAGIPILSIAGKEGGYELMPRFRLDKKYLTLDDLLSIQWALNSVQQATGFEEIHQLVLKINQLIEPSAMKEKSIQLDMSSTTIQMEHVKTIYNAIQNGDVLRICYVDHRGTETDRSIEPMGIYLKDGFWYTWAYCLLRNELRVFKLTRIVDIYLTGCSFIRRPFVIEDIDANRGQSVESETTTFTAYLQFNSCMRAKVLDDFREEEIINNQDGKLSIAKEFYSMDQAISQILSYGNQVRIIYPKELMTTFIEHIEEIRQLYNE
ncbi:WYL domain-containing protein [Gracilibacillus salitolerans]|uniref:WYL domain-containing protein n=1 Tax=Gracilibacillus salitolerans TaxID=2663022 RepID=A0A5Q2TRD0_9BACI|nr:YafY family protein [Gracilibacillus salitolerans]QGH36662.1 WYL domain-containing protein [Gracilibacillus salitolerans]